jgi:hypothetical protein
MRWSCLLLIGALFILIPHGRIGRGRQYQMGYSYPFDGMARDGRQTKTFMICEYEPAAGPYLSRATRFPALS